MKKTTYFILLAIASCIAIMSCNDSKKEADDNDEGMKAMSNEDMVARGEYLVATTGCDNCHTPKMMTDHGPVPDMSKRLSGHPAASMLAPYDKSMVGPWVLFAPDLTAAVGPWGTTYSANLTPSQSGIGSWNEDQFLNAIKNGKHLGMDNQRPIMPPMPWEEFSKMKDDDLKSIYAFLKTVTPIDNVVPAFEPAAPM